MKVILSRKGFDSAYGGYSSPILPNGRMLSLPIPAEGQTCYSDLQLNSETNSETTYYDIMCELQPKRYKDERYELTKTTKCHLDPDIYRHVVNRLPGWKACFGPLGIAKSHLDNQCVKEDDLFLFFGWFRNTKRVEGRLEFIGCDIHVIFGYMQIGEIVSVDLNYKEPEWMKGHPHLLNIFRKKKNNTIYVAREQLSWDSNIHGADIFNFDSSLVLTKQGFSRSKWELPEFFKCAEISFHSKDNWKDGYFQSAYIGQEFVIKDHEKIENWAKNLIKENIRKGSDLDDQ
jgi:hypothetical protein